MEAPAAFNIRASAPEGLSEIIRMGREISNLQGIFGGSVYEVAHFGPEAKGDDLLCYV